MASLRRGVKQLYLTQRRDGATTEKYNGINPYLQPLNQSTHQLVGTVGLEKLLPELVKAIDQVGNEGEELVDHSFRQGVLFILIAMGAYVVARLIYNFLNKKLINPS